MSVHLGPMATTPAATVAFAMAVLVIGRGVTRSLAHPGRAGAELAAALGLGLEFLLAAGLLRLATGPELRDLGLVAIVIAVRKISSSGLNLAARAVSGMVGGRLRA